MLVLKGRNRLEMSKPSDFRRFLMKRRNFWLLLGFCLVAMLFPFLVHGGEPVAFEWDYANPSSDLAAFWLYRSPSSASFAQDAIVVLKLYNFPKTTRACVEKNVPNGVWYWRLTAVDTEGNESDFSNEVTTAISDTTAPDGPTNLRRVALIILGEGKILIVFS